jgi:putative phosphoesterase
MKIALIGDVHANLHALQAVVEHARAQGAETFWNIGDFVGYGAFPDEVVKLLAEAAAINIIGNYDQTVLDIPEKGHAKRRKGKHPEKVQAADWTSQHLSPWSRDFLSGLSAEARTEIQSFSILLVHASLGSMEEHLTPETNDSRFAELARMARADIVVFGHSHVPFTRNVSHTLFINPGSVGRPSDGDPRASYAILTLAPQSENPMSVEHFRVAYDVDAAAEAIRERGLPEAFAQMILQGRGLEETVSGDEDNKASFASNGKLSDRLQPVIALAEQSHYEAPHTQQVTRLALSLFDELKGVHGFGDEERFYLECAGLLHDIGWVGGRKGHHKTSLKMIENEASLPFDERERRIIGSIARYHRRALPKAKHKHFAALSAEDQVRVSVLAGILRVADGLDRTHANVVQSLSCDILSDDLILRCTANATAEEERDYALDKGKLLEKTLHRKLKIEFQEA